MKKIYSVILLTILLLSEKNSFGQSGSLDPSFGVNGKFILGQNFSFETAQDIAITKEGKLLVLNDNGYSYLMRFGSDGELDSTFGIGGRVSVSGGFETSQSIVIDDSNRIYVMTWSSWYGPNLYIKRYLPDGSEDPNYYVTLEFEFGDNAFFIQPDGKVVVAGSNGNIATAERFNQDGSPDTTFGINGVLNFLDANSECMVLGAAQQADGKLLFCGTHDGNLFITRLLNDGTPDITWGIAGTKFLYDGTKAVAQDIATTADGKIIVTGYNQNGDSISSFKCWRFFSDGSLDYTFDWNGVAIATGKRQNWGSYVFPNNDGSVIVGGTIYNGATNDAMVYHLVSNGQVDSTFGNNGIVEQTFTSSKSIELNAVRDSSGNILMSGTQFSNGNDYAAVAKILPTGNLDTSFASNGITINLAAYQIEEGPINDFDLLPDGNILSGATANQNLALLRLSDEGVIDTSFGENGIYIPGQEGDSWGVRAAYRNNNIYLIQRFHNRVFGYETLIASIWGDGTDNFLVRKFLPSGVPDSTYGTFGALHPTVTGYELHDCSSALVQPDGKLLLSGAIDVLPFGTNIYVIRLNPDGTTDENFGINGIVELDYLTWDENNHMALDSQGRIIIQYDNPTVGIDTLLTIRLLANGSLDSDFGENGVAKFPIAYGHDLPRAMQVLSDNKILSLINNDNNNNHFFIRRFNTDGSPDSTYGTNGRASLFKFPFFNGFNYTPLLTLQQDGKALCIGKSPLTLVRLRNDGIFDSTFNDDGISFPDSITSPTFGAVHLQDDGKILICGHSSQGFYMCRILNDIETGLPSPVQSQAIDVFPNPFEDALYVKLSGEKYKSRTVRLFDLLGGEVFKKEIGSNQNFLSIKTSELSPGIYFLNVKNADKSFTVKVVKSF